jgi:uncharacterized membrane protein YozB (DUF420 family)
MNYHTSLSILIFLIIYFSITWFKPSFLFNHDGSIREFGIGRKQKTIIPLWLIILVLSFLSYLLIHILLQYNLISI